MNALRLLSRLEWRLVLGDTHAQVGCPVRDVVRDDLEEPGEGEIMELSADQLRAVESGEAVPITVDQTPCVLIRADIYERVQAMLDIEAAYPLIDETFQEGWEAPGMADYDRYDELKRP